MLGWMFRRTGKRDRTAPAASPVEEARPRHRRAAIEGFPRGLPDGDRDKPGATGRWPSLNEMAALESRPGGPKMSEWRPGMFLLGRDELGRYYGHDDDRHVLTVAGSRAGKGVSLIVPNLLFWPGSCIVIDPKGELATLTASRRSAKGSAWSVPMTPGVGEVYALDPFGRVSGDARQHAFAGFNPMAEIDVTKPGGFDRCSLLADALIVQATGEGAHWTQGARALTLLLIYFVAATMPEEKNLIAVRRLLMRRGRALTDLFEEMAGLGDPFISESGKAWQGTREGELQSVVASAATQTAFIDGPEMAAVLSRSSFRLDELKEKRITVYLCLPALRLATHGKWFRMIVNMAMDAMERTGPLRDGQHRVLFCLDEFGAMGDANETIEKSAGQIASFGVKLWPIIQDLSQLKRDYPSSWETFMGNAGLLLFFGNTDLSTTEFIAKRLGETETVRWTENASESWQTSTGDNRPNPLGSLFGAGGGGGSSRGANKGGNRGRNQSMQRVPLMQASEVVGAFARERGNILALIPDKPPLALNRVVHYSPEDDALCGGFFGRIDGQQDPLTRAGERVERDGGEAG